jgi:hypothetical protein
MRAGASERSQVQMTDNNAGQQEQRQTHLRVPQDEAEKRIMAQFQEGHKVLRSIQSVKEALLTAISQDADQYELGGIGRQHALGIQRELKRLGLGAGNAIEEGGEEQLRAVKQNYKDWRTDTEELLRYELFDTEEVYDKFVFHFGYGGPGRPGYIPPLQERFVALEKKLSEDLHRLRGIRKQVKIGHFPAPQPRPTEDEAADRVAAAPDWVPKKRGTRERWKAAYSIMVELKRIYREEYEDLNREYPDPKIGDYRDALANNMGWKPSDKTTGRIKKAGDNRWLG